MKPTLGLSFSLGLLVTLSAACNDGKSKHDSNSTPPAQLTGPAQTTPVTTPQETSPATGNNTIPGTSNNPNVPEIPVAPPVAGGTTGTNTPGTTPGTTTNVPAGNASAKLHGIWGVALAQKPRSCSSLYDLRDQKTVSIHILCPASAGKNIAVQSERFSIVSDDGAKITLQKTASTCSAPLRIAPLVLNYVVSTNGTQSSLQFTDGNGNSPALQGIDETTLAGDLSSAATLYGRPVVRGCFTGGQLAKFVSLNGVAL